MASNNQPTEPTDPRTQRVLNFNQKREAFFQEAQAKTVKQYRATADKPNEINMEIEPEEVLSYEFRKPIDTITTGVTKSQDKPESSAGSIMSDGTSLEWSDAVDGRVDVEQYFRGLQRLSVGFQQCPERARDAYFYDEVQKLITDLRKIIFNNPQLAMELQQCINNMYQIRFGRYESADPPKAQTKPPPSKCQQALPDTEEVTHFRSLGLQVESLARRPMESRNTNFYNSVELLINKLETVFVPKDVPLLATEREVHLVTLNQLLTLKYQQPPLQSTPKATLQAPPNPGSDLSVHMAMAAPFAMPTFWPTAALMTPFDGHAANLPHFIATFKELIGSHQYSTERYKLDQLAKLVPAEASYIKAQASVEVALEALSKRYAASGAVLAEVFEAVDAVPDLTTRSTIDDWRQLETAILQAERLLPSTATYELETIHLHLKNKLGPELNAYRRNGGRDLTSLAKAVATKIGWLREEKTESFYLRRARPEPKQAKAKATDPPRARNNKSPPKFPVLAITEQVEESAAVAPSLPIANAQQVRPSQQPKREIDPCWFCGGSHLRRDCPLSHQDRLLAITRAARCTKCLLPSAGHVCRGRGCGRCKSNYHYLLCQCLSAQALHQACASKPSTGLAPPPPPPGGNNGNAANGPGGPTIGGTSSNNPNNQAGNARSNKQTSVNSMVCALTAPKITYLPILKVDVHNEQATPALAARMVLDTASTRTIIAENVVDKLRLPKIAVQPTVVDVFGGKGQVCLVAEALVTIQSRVDPTVTTTILMDVMGGVLIGQLPAASQHMLTQAQQLGIELSDVSTSPQALPIDILLGQDHYSDHVILEQQTNIKFEEGMSFANTRYGWVAQGLPGGRKARSNEQVHFISSGPVQNQCMAMFTNYSECSGLCQDITRLFPDLSSDDSRSDKTVRDWCDSFCDRLEYDAGAKRYVAPLPWFNDQRPDSNYASARAQCFALYERLNREGRLPEYNDYLEDLINSNYARQLHRWDPTKGYYVPHFPVYKESSETTKVRPVFNAGASIRGRRSLNACIFKGVWDQVQLVEILIRMRMHRHVLLADIKKAFLQIHIRPADRQYIRFLWITGGELKVYEMNSLLFGATSSPFILHAVLRHLFQTNAPELEHIIADTYMDDTCLVANDIEELRTTYQQVQKVMSIASFELHKIAAIPETAAALNIESKTGITSCLGLTWCLDTDRILFKVPQLSSGVMTRRTLASDFAKTFDPLQLLGPFHTQVKILFRDLIPSNQDWDSPVSSEVEAQAKALLVDLLWLPAFAVTRLACPSDNFEYWCFGDASSIAYGCVIYVFDCLTKKATLLVARGKLAPKGKSIPQLELMAAKMTAECYHIIRRCLPKAKPTRVRLFTDSQATWARIQADPNRFDQFVANRVRRIVEITSPADWYYIRTAANPADLISRGRTLRLLRCSELWFHGPPLKSIQDSEEETAKLSSRPATSCVFALTNTGTPVSAILDHMVNGHNKDRKHHWLHRAIRHMLVYMNQFVDLAKRYEAVRGVRVQLHELTDIYLWRIIQKVIFPEELLALESGQPLPVSSSLTKENLKLDQHGVLRLDKRLEYADLPFEVKYPIVLRDSHAASSYIRYIHKTFANHGGATITEAFVKTTVYLPNIARIVQAAVYDCLTCRRYRRGKPFKASISPLPPFRVQRGFAFQSVGIDIAGPIRDGTGKRTKYYILLFVCLKSRALHLELIMSRETPAICRAFTRFSCTYGRPVEVWSDNELGFKKMSWLMTTLYTRYHDAMKKLQQSMELSQTEWHFNTPAAPWRGGAWERLVQTVKRAIDRTKLAAAQDYEQLLTVLCEAQRFVNSRPLLVKPGKPALTPAHLVFGRPLDYPIPLKIPSTCNRDGTLLDYAHLQGQLNEFWSVWQSQYLTSLRQQYWKATEPPIKGEMVIIKNDNTPRYSWPLAIITEIKPSPLDGLYRTAMVQPLDGSEPCRRAIQRLIPIERDLALQGDNVTLRQSQHCDGSDTNTNDQHCNSSADDSSSHDAID